MTNVVHLTMVILKFWPWSWGQIFDHLTMTPGHDPCHRTGARPGSRDQGPSQASLDAFIDLSTYMKFQ